MSFVTQLTKKGLSLPEAINFIKDVKTYAIENHSEVSFKNNTYYHDDIKGYGFSTATEAELAGAIYKFAKTQNPNVTFDKIVLLFQMLLTLMTAPKTDTWSFSIK